MNDDAARLKRHLAAHNRHVLTVSAGSLVVVAVLWALVYFGLYWLILLGITVVHPEDAQVPLSLPARFLSFAALLVGAVALATWNKPARRPRDDTRWSEVALDLLLLLPRATVGAVENLAAFQPLNRREIGRAWSFLQRFEQERFLPLTTLALEIPHAPSRERILRALQYSQLVELCERDGAWVLTLRGQAARHLLGERFRLR